MGGDKVYAMGYCSWCRRGSVHRQKGWHCRPYTSRRSHKEALSPPCPSSAAASLNSDRLSLWLFSFLSRRSMPLFCSVRLFCISLPRSILCRYLHQSILSVCLSVCTSLPRSILCLTFWLWINVCLPWSVSDASYRSSPHIILGFLGTSLRGCKKTSPYRPSPSAVKDLGFQGSSRFSSSHHASEEVEEEIRVLSEETELGGGGGRNIQLGFLIIINY